MTSLKGDLRSIMGTPFGGVGHAVLIFSRVTRAAFNSDSVVLQLHDRIEMPEEADGKFRVDGLDPGPIRIELEGGTVHNHGWNIDLPDEGVWSLTDLVDAQVDWSPAVIGRAEAAAREARDHADRAEAGADRVGTAEQVGVWAGEASSSASAAASARSGAVTARDAAQSARDAAEGHANRAATSESNAKTSETNAKQSETNAGDYAAVATTAATEAVDAMERATDLAGGDFATHEYVDNEVAAAKWYRGGLGSSDNLDDYRGLAYQGLYRVTTGVGGGTGLTGWVEVTYDDNSARTRQVFTSSSPTNAVSLERKYSDGVWRDWSPVTWSGVVVNSGSADNLLAPHVYAINSASVTGIPVSVPGSLETLPAGAGVASRVQRFTTRESSPRMWVRSRTANVWSGWARLTTEQDVEETVTRLLDELDISSTPTPIVFNPDETAATGGSVIVQSLSLDRRVGYNALTSTLRQTFDEGATWEDVRAFAGANIEWVRALPNGELMVETTSRVEGVAGVRRIWVSTGYDQYNPTAATWEVTLTAAAPLVKFADWSISITDEMILLAEYGPKQGVVWGSGSEPIGEGLNARYIYRSYDNGKTWDTIFDLNDFLLAGGRETADGQHLHGVAWDPYWDRIWVTFGDATGGGSNGVLYSDNEGQSWHAAYWTHTHTSLGWQVVGIQPMKDCVLFAGDMTPSGVIRLDRNQGKHPSSFEFETGWDYSETEKHLCQQIIHFDNGRSESAFFAFSREGTTSPSFIVATKNGWDWDLLWASSDNPLPGIRTIAGPTKKGNLIAAVNSSSGWRRVFGRVDAY